MITLKQLLEKFEEAGAIEGHEFKEGVTPTQRKNYAGVYQHFIRPSDTKEGAFVHASSIPKHLASHLRKYGSASLIGAEAPTTHDLAVLAQIHRDPRVESLHMIYTKGNKIVGHNTVSSRMPGLVQPFRFNENPTNRFMSMQEDMKHFGADGYYMLHNHPSGRSVPSQADVRLTEAMGEAIPGMKSHIVIDNSEYHTISPNGIMHHHKLDRPIHYDLENPEHHLKHHPVIGMKISSEHELAEVGKHFEDPSHVTLVGTYGSTGKVNSVVGMPPHLLEKNDKASMSRVQHFARHAGSSRQFLIVPTNADQKKYEHHITNGTVTDIVSRQNGEGIRKHVFASPNEYTYGIDPKDIKQYGSISNRDDF